LLNFDPRSQIEELAEVLDLGSLGREAVDRVIGVGVPEGARRAQDR